MPKFKVLKGVAHNIGDSFTSLMNFYHDDYSLGHILRLARESGMNTLTLDLLTGNGTPAELLKEPIAELPRRYSDMFLRIVQSSGSARELIQSASLTLTYDLQRTELAPLLNKLQNHYVCEVSIADIRGKIYSSYLSGWWFVERTTEVTQEPNGYDRATASQWWNPFRWLRSLFRPR